MKERCNKTRGTRTSMRLLALLLSFVCVIGGLGVHAPIAVKAVSGAEITKTDTSVSIGNAYISRNYKIESGKIYTASIENKRTQKTTTFQSGSEDFVIKLTDNTEIKSSALTYKDSKEDTADEGVKKLRIDYNAAAVGGESWEISQIVVLADEEFYIRSFLEIKAPATSTKAIDYIDTDAFVLPSGIETWTHLAETSADHFTMSNLSDYHLMLGQPVYADGLFLGCEFPETDTRIVKSSNSDKVQIRYYSGKSFAKMKEDAQLTDDGKFVTWQNVVGAAEGTDTLVVQTAFFQYIEAIATPTVFRRQYNSWYDNMKRISDESIAASFYDMEKEMSRNGVEPLVSYVVDDGWIAYSDETNNGSLDAETGTEYNRTGFWEFNSKFPNELYTSNELASKLHSSFGMWLGPRGGYGRERDIATLIQNSGTGYVSSHSDICVGSHKYIKNLQALFLDYQDRFDISYWKWDGFADQACTNANHDHMTGGTNNMYFFTDMWEHWIKLFEAVRAERAEKNKDLFINATCYVNLSPWLLQWVNTVWLQDSADTQQVQGTAPRHVRKIYYRDGVYYRLFADNGSAIQFPLKNVYNHEPIYGIDDNINSPGGSNATTNEFRQYMFANAMRGTAFWELYYSPSIVSEEKWKVTKDIMDWIRDNQHILKNAKFFGNDPTTQTNVYGYSCWNGKEGIVSFVNSTGSSQTYDLTITDIVGADKNMGTLKGIQVYPFQTKDPTRPADISYNGTIHVTVPANEMVIYQYGLEDAEAPEIVSAKVTGDKEVTVKYSERVHSGQFTVDGKSAEATELDDYRTIVLKTQAAIGREAEVSYSIKDQNDNVAEAKMTLTNYKDDVIVKPQGVRALKNAGSDITVGYDAFNDIVSFSGISKGYTVTDSANAKKQLKGTGDFSVNIGVKTSSKGVELMSSGDGEVKLGINSNGYVEFTVKGQKVVGDELVTTITTKSSGTFNSDSYKAPVTEQTHKGLVSDGQPHSITAVREVNGLLKLYIDGELRASAYDEEKVNENLKGGAITVGGNGFTGELSGFEILNRATAYDELKDLAAEAPEAGTSFEVIPERSTWTATACSEMDATTADANAMAALDGNTNSWWHTKYVNATPQCQCPHWIKVDFHGPETLSKVMYTGRGFADDGTPINGSFKEYTLELFDKDGNTIFTKDGTFITSTEEQVIDLGKTYTAYGFKLTGKSTMNGKEFGAAVELRIASEDHVMTEAELTEAKEELTKADEGDYTGASWNRYQDVLEMALAAKGATQENWEKVKEEVAAAEAELVSMAPFTAAEKAAEQSPAAEENDKNRIDYTRKSYQAFKAALAEAGDFAERAETEEFTAEEVQAAADALKAATQALVKREDPVFTFKDVDKSLWFAPEIYDAVELGVMEGKYEGTIFEPGKNILRAEFAITLHNLAGNPEPEKEPVKFTDTAGWYEKALAAIDWASTAQTEGMDTAIITGYGDPAEGPVEFRPGKTISRQEMAIMLYRYAKYKGYDTSLEEDPNAKVHWDDFADKDSNQIFPTAVDALKWSVAKGIITGVNKELPNGTTEYRLNPTDPTPRAQAATMLVRFKETFEK